MRIVCFIEKGGEQNISRKSKNLYNNLFCFVEKLVKFCKGLFCWFYNVNWLSSKQIATTKKCKGFFRSHSSGDFILKLEDTSSCMFDSLHLHISFSNTWIENHGKQLLPGSTWVIGLPRSCLKCIETSYFSDGSNKSREGSSRNCNVSSLP